MITPHKNRTIDRTKPVKVYWNLHRDCYSIQQDGLVVAHADQVELRDVDFKVSETGRQRVLKERRKNVHAFVVGFVDDALTRYWDVKIVYNPYKYNSFRLWTDDRVTVKSAEAVILRIRNGRGDILAERRIGTSYWSAYK
jgi:hypothetical protein